MPIDIWGFESELYVAIDASGMKGKTRLEERFELGEGQFVDVRITSKKNRVLQNSMIVCSGDMDFAIAFWLAGNKKRNGHCWYRIDNHRNFLHMHAKGKEPKDHEPLPEGVSLSQLLSNAFEECKSYLRTSGEKIGDSQSFYGFSSGKVRVKKKN